MKTTLTKKGECWIQEGKWADLHRDTEHPELFRIYHTDYEVQQMVHQVMAEKLPDMADQFCHGEADWKKGKEG